MKTFRPHVGAVNLVVGWAEKDGKVVLAATEPDAEEPFFLASMSIEEAEELSDQLTREIENRREPLQ